MSWFSDNKPWFLKNQTSLIVGGILGLGTILIARRISGNSLSYSGQKPARDYSLEEAIVQMDEFANEGLVDIISKGDRMVIGGNIDGVQYSYLPDYFQRKTIDNLDPRFGVFLVRLSQFLRNDLGVTEVLEQGITHGGDNPMDCHNQGRAIDLAGIRGPNIDLNVLRDWGNKPEKPEGGYRLLPSDPGYKEFAMIYDFAAAMAANKSCDRIPVEDGIEVMGNKSCIIYPDHPTDLRFTHKNHLHIQLGPTFWAW